MFMLIFYLIEFTCIEWQINNALVCLMQVELAWGYRNYFYNDPHRDPRVSQRHEFRESSRIMNFKYFTSLNQEAGE